MSYIFLVLKFLPLCLVLYVQAMAESKLRSSRSKKQYFENDSYFRSSRMNTLSKKVSNQESRLAINTQFSSRADLAESQGNRTYDQSFSISGAFRFNEKISLTSQFGLNYYSLGNSIPKEESNPKWDDASVGVVHYLGEYYAAKLSQSFSESIPTSFDSQYEGIQSSLNYTFSLSHPLFFLEINHGLAVNYTWHSFEYSPTTNRKNSNWTNSYILTVAAPYRFNKQWTVGLSENIAQKSSFNNDYLLVTSTLVYASYQLKKWKINLNYLVGTYDENRTIRYFYSDEFQQKIGLGLSYDI